MAGKMTQLLRTLTLEDLSLIPILSSSQPPLTPVPGQLMRLVSLDAGSHPYRLTHIHN